MSRQLRAPRPRPGPIVWENHKFTFSHYQDGEIRSFRCCKRQSVHCPAVLKHDPRLRENSMWLVGKHSDKCIEATPQIILRNVSSEFIYVCCLYYFIYYLIYLTLRHCFFVRGSYVTSSKLFLVNLPLLQNRPYLLQMEEKMEESLAP